MESIVPVLVIVIVRSMGYVICDATMINATGDIVCRLFRRCLKAGRILVGMGSRGISLMFYSVLCMDRYQRG